MRLTVLAPLMALAGCAHQQTMWVRDGATQADFERDRAQCVYEANAATASYSSGPTRRSMSGAIAQGIEDGITIGLRQRELAMLCMKARGYAEVPIGYLPPEPAPPPQPVPTQDPPHQVIQGRWSYNVETVARQARCHDQPVARRATEVGESEIYSVRCGDGSTLMVRCDDGNCRVLR